MSNPGNIWRFFHTLSHLQLIWKITIQFYLKMKIGTLTYRYPIWDTDILVEMVYMLHYFRGASYINRNECSISFSVNMYCPRLIYTTYAFIFCKNEIFVLKIVLQNINLFQNLIPFFKMPKIMKFLCQTSHNYLKNKKK